MIRQALSFSSLLFLAGATALATPGSVLAQHAGGGHAGGGHFGGGGRESTGEEPWSSDLPYMDPRLIPAPATSAV